MDPLVGFWQITPSNEFRVGGPIKSELNSHVGPTTLAVSFLSFFDSAASCWFILCNIIINLRFLQVLIMVEVIWLSNLAKMSGGRKYSARFSYISIALQAKKTLTHFGMMLNTRFNLFMLYLMVC